MGGLRVPARYLGSFQFTAALKTGDGHTAARAAPKEGRKIAPQIFKKRVTLNSAIPFLLRYFEKRIL